MKRFLILLLATSMLIVTSCKKSSTKTYEETDCEKELKSNVTYKYDLDGDKDKESIKVYEKNDKVLLEVNKKRVIITPKKNKESYSFDVKIYDFNKNDKTLDIVATTNEYAINKTRIIKFKNDKCMLNEAYNDTTIHSYNPTNGEITFYEHEGGRYTDFCYILGSFGCLSKAKIYDYKLENENKAEVCDFVKENKYIASKDLLAYKDVKNKEEAFKIKKNDKVQVCEFYKDNNNLYVKVKKFFNKEGYIKVNPPKKEENYTSSLIFTEDSCLWLER